MMWRRLDPQTEVNFDGPHECRPRTEPVVAGGDGRRAHGRNQLMDAGGLQTGRPVGTGVPRRQDACGHGTRRRGPETLRTKENVLTSQQAPFPGDGLQVTTTGTATCTRNAQPGLSRENVKQAGHWTDARPAAFKGVSVVKRKPDGESGSARATLVAAWVRGPWGTSVTRTGVLLAEL